MHLDCRLTEYPAFLNLLSGNISKSAFVWLGRILSEFKEIKLFLEFILKKSWQTNIWPDIPYPDFCVSMISDQFNIRSIPSLDPDPIRRKKKISDLFSFGVIIKVNTVIFGYNTFWFIAIIFGLPLNSTITY